MIHRRSFAFILLLIPFFFTACTEVTSNGGGNGKKKEQEDNFQVIPGQTTALQFTHFEMNFKPVTSGDTVVAAYPFKNMSKGTVQIENVVTSCACIQPEFPKGNIQPGQTGEIVAKFYTKGQWGTHQKILAVTMKDGSAPITLRLNGQINKAAGDMESGPGIQ